MAVSPLVRVADALRGSVSGALSAGKCGRDWGGEISSTLVALVVEHHLHVFAFERPAAGMVPFVTRRR